jgi:hypothetical protein
MSWTDPSPPAGLARYKIRRECLDTRFVWESAEVPESPTATTASLVSATAAANEVSLTWLINGTSSVRVYRSLDSLAWSVLGKYVVDGQQHVTVIDSAVEAGHRYGYRLSLLTGDNETTAGETWVDVPMAEFALRRVFPNPAVGGFAISFSLPSTAPARLEVFDLSGRRVVARDVGGLGPGVHTLALETGAGRLPAGVYAVRLTQGKHDATAKVSVLR